MAPALPQSADNRLQ